MDNNRKKKNSTNYRFKSLRVYTSAEAVGNDQRRYRKVFENMEVDFLYIELALFNRLYDRKPWRASFSFVCYKLMGKAREEFCRLETEREISTEDDMVYIREGWGNEEPGHIWKRGDYCWEVLVDGESLGINYFYIEDFGVVTPEDNPYFDLINIELFEGPRAGVEPAKRQYLKSFKSDETRYVWGEISIDNLQSQSWFCEIICNFYHESKELKGCVSELRQVKPHDRELSLLAGWGALQPGSWQPGRYLLEVRFMGQTVAMVPFECGDKKTEGSNPLIYSDDTFLQLSEEEQESRPVQGQQPAREQLEALTGLFNIKKQVKEYLHYLQFLKIRQEKGFRENEKLQLHSVFTGNPGTGKTTVARLLGKIYHELGMLSKDSFQEVGRAELVGQYIGQTAPKVKDVIESARGGVLFIDEAYALARNEKDDKDYGNEVIEVLVKELSDGPGDIAIFVAGYPAEMETFLRSNPGLRSRFKAYYHFADYQPEELLQIAKNFARENEIAFTRKAEDFLLDYLTRAYKNRDKSFGNARLVGKIVEDVKMAMALRLMDETEDVADLSHHRLRTARLEDIRKVVKEHPARQSELKINEEELNKALADVNRLIGLKSVKQNVEELITLVRYYRETSSSVLGRFSLHTVFKGNPGTGKTTMARLLGQIYNALGILERGHLIECSRQDLVAGFVGQTAIKTQEVISRAMGGVLFIDEAYSLFSEGGREDFGKEAVETILKAMEDNRGKFVVIMAGYTNEMNRLLKMNPGLKSRFDHELLFEDYNTAELVRIAEDMLAGEQLKMDQKARVLIKSLLQDLQEGKDRFFGNARTVRKLVEEASRKHHLRIARLSPAKRSRKVVNTITEEDLQNISPDVLETSDKKIIGFRRGKGGAES